MKLFKNLWKYQILFLTLLFYLVSFPVISFADGYRLLVAPEKDRIILRWSLPLDGNFPDGFVVERKSKKDKEWKRLTEKPLLREIDKEKIKMKLGEEFFSIVETLLFPPSPDFKNQKRAVSEGRTRNSLLLLYADISPPLADVLAIRYVDTQVSAGEEYLYRILEVWKGEVMGVIAQTTRPVKLEDYRPLPKVTQIKGVPGDKSAYFRWVPDRIFSAYEIFRSESPEGKFEKVNKAPIIIPIVRKRDGSRRPKYFYIDKNLMNDRKYYYVVRGIDPFGRISPESNMVEVIPIDLTPPLAPIGLSSEVENDTVILRWKDSLEKDLRGYHVYRAAFRKGTFKKLTKKPLGRGETLFVDEGLPIGSTFWYQITAVDKAGNESGPSVPVYVKVHDKVPPVTPKGLSAKTEPGKVLLSWLPNEEKDLRGYKIFRSTKNNADQYQLVNIEPVKEASFTDVLPENMSEISIFYRVKAVDYSYNESGFSETIEIRLPDVTPPDRPRIKDFTVAEGKITLEWHPNIEKDLAGYNLFREEKGVKEKRKVNEELIPQEKESYTDDNGLKPGTMYRYTLVAVDDDGNVSPPSRIVTASTFDATPPPPPSQFTAMYDMEKKVTKLSWKNPDSSDFKGVILFRSKREKGPFFPLTGIVKKSSYTDGDVRRGKTYHYRLVAFDEANNSSPPSKTVTVSIPLKEKARGE